MLKKNRERIEGNLKINSVNEIKTALIRLIIARAMNHFCPAISSSFASHASKYPEGNAASKMKI